MMLEFPASKFVDFFYNHGMLSVDDRPVWKVLKGGSRSYLPLITQPFRDSIRLQSPVQRVKRLKDAVEVSTPMGTERFDHIVFASHADETLQILRESNDLMPGEEALLSAIPYQENDTILHTDSSVLPKNPRAWAAWNTFLPKEANRKVAITYLMNHLQGFDAPVNFCVSLNLSDRIDPKTVLRRLTYHHPIFTTEGVRAQAEWNSISRMDRRTHFCGAYWFHGFHEDGVRSGLRVAETFGETLEGASWQRSTRH
jgi:predicted NAD/FAD-binding protein